MIIFKSLFRKKITKIYLFIVTSIFLAIGILLLARNYYIVEGNKNYEGSYFQFLAPLSEMDKIKKGINVEKVIVGLNRKLSEEEGYLWSELNIFVDETLKGFNTKVWQSYTRNKDNPDNYFDKIILMNNGNKVELNIVASYESTGDDGNFISQEVFDKLYDGKENVIYRVEVVDYFKQNKTEKWLQENINISHEEGTDNGIGFTEVSKSRAPLYTLYVLLFTFLSIALGIIFVIILIYTIVNIIIDEKKSSILLKHLGYKNRKILMTTILKIASILLIPFIISSIILIPIYLIW